MYRCITIFPRLARATTSGSNRLQSCNHLTTRVHGLDGLSRVPTPPFIRKLLELRKVRASGGEPGSCYVVEADPQTSIYPSWRALLERRRTLANVGRTVSLSYREYESITVLLSHLYVEKGHGDWHSRIQLIPRSRAAPQIRCEGGPRGGDLTVCTWRRRTATPAGRPVSQRPA
jgi:hypothetical protein